MKTKIFSFLVGLLVAVAGFGQESGTIGTLTWSFDGVETLTISGEGEMVEDYYPPWYNYYSSIKNVIIGEGVTSVGVGFGNCLSLTSITIPSSVTTLGDMALGGYRELTELNFNADSCNISWPFGTGWTNLKTVNIGSNVRHIPSNAFFGCSGITSINIPSSITSIGELAFRDCHSLTSITIPSSVTSIGAGAFSNCSKLTSINVESGNINYSSVDGVLFNKDKTTLVGYPNGKTGNYIVPSNVRHIGDWAFCGYAALTITLPELLKTIGNYAFSICNLRNIVIPDEVTSVGDYAFYHCPNLTYASVGNKVLTIGENAFYNCTKLITISLGESLNSIGHCAFGYTPNIRNIYCYGKIAADCALYNFGDEIFMNAKLYYPANASGYSTSPVWIEFENRFYLDVEEREVKVKPSTNNTQQLTIPPVFGAAAYDLVIYANANRTDVVCTISFDAEGHLTGITLRGGDDIPFSCTVNGLKSGTTYHYTMTAYNSDQEIVEQKMGSFKTADEGTGVVGALHATPLPEIIGYYTLLGQKLPQEPEKGIYIILYDNGKSEKIMKYKE